MKKFWKKALKKALEYLIAGMGVMVLCLSTASAGQAGIMTMGQVYEIGGIASGGTVFDDFKLCYGTSCPYWQEYNSTGNAWEWWTTDGDGGGTDTLLLSVPDGTDNFELQINQRLVFDGQAGSNDYFYSGFDGFIDVWTAGAQTAQFGSSRLKLPDGISLALGNAPDFGISFDAGDNRLELVSGGNLILDVNNATQAVDFHAEPKGAVSTVDGAHEDLTCSASATLTTSGLIPDGAFLLGVSTRVTTALTTATAFNVGDGSDADIYGVQSTVTQGQTTDNADATATLSNPQLAAGEVTLTFTGTCDAGVIRVVAHYVMIGAPTSN